MRCLKVFLLCLIFPALAMANDVYQQPEDFINEVFAGKPPQRRVLSLTDSVRNEIKEILGHDLGVMRLRYWGEDGRTAWILEETGKERPITTGIVVNKGKLELLKVLIYRESRGSEVRHPFFTDQFKGATLEKDDELDRPIDGISGATLSTRALTRLVRLALYLHQQSEQANVAN